MRLAGPPRRILPAEGAVESLTWLLPEVAARPVLQARRHGAEQAGLAPLSGGLHQQQGRQAQQRPQEGEPALNVATQLGTDHPRVETEGGNS